MDQMQLQRMEQDIRMRIRALDQKRKSVGTPKMRLGMATDLLLKILAVFFDVVGVLAVFIPYVGGFIASAVTIVATAVFVIAYILLRITPINLKSKVTQRTLTVRIITFLFELIPYLNAVPAFSIAIWYSNHMVRKEDREYNMSIQKAIKEIEAEERSIRQDMRTLTELSERSGAEQQYSQYEEATMDNHIYDDKDEAYREAA